MNPSHTQNSPKKWLECLSLQLIFSFVCLSFITTSVVLADASGPQVNNGSSSEPSKSNTDTATVDNSTEPAPVPAVVGEDEMLQKASKDTTSPGNVSLDFKDADILNVLRVLSLKSGTNIVAGPEVQGTVTIRLQDVPWEKAMEVVLRTYGYVYEREGNIIRVTTKENLSSEELITQTFVLNYTTAAEVETAVKDMLTERGRVKSVPRANTVIVSDVTTNMYKISQVITTLDQVTQQVYIDALIVRTELGNSEDIGIKWNPTGTLTGGSRAVTFPWSAAGTELDNNPLNVFRAFYPSIPASPGDDVNPAPTGAITPTPITTPFTTGTLSFANFQSTINFLRSKTNTKIVSNPRIVVLNNQTAKVQVGSEIPIPTFERNETTGSFVISGFSYRDVGIVLNVTPHINQSREILVDLKPEVSSRGDDVSFGQGGFQAPSFNTTMAQTQLLVKDNETIAIGGLKKDAEQVRQDSVPGLSKIPLIGKLFRNTTATAGDNNQKHETLFFITIRIVDTQGQPTIKQKPTASVTQPVVAQTGTTQTPAAVGVKSPTV